MKKELKKKRFIMLVLIIIPLIFILCCVITIIGFRFVVDTSPALVFKQYQSFITRDDCYNIHNAKFKNYDYELIQCSNDKLYLISKNTINNYTEFEVIEAITESPMAGVYSTYESPLRLNPVIDNKTKYDVYKLSPDLRGYKDLDHTTNINCIGIYKNSSYIGKISRTQYYFGSNNYDTSCENYSFKLKK